MNTFLFKRAIIVGLIAVVLLPSCDDKDNTPPPPVTPTNDSFTQSFETMAGAQSQGWIFKYQSDDADFTYPWEVETVAAVDGTHAIFSFNDYLNNGNSHDQDSAISNWAISPVVWFQNGDSIIFYTYSSGQTQPVPIIGGRVADRLQLRMTRLDSSSNTGTTSTDVGSFTFPLVDINPNLSTAAEAYPSTWKRYAAVVKGLNAPFQGRFAIRHFVPDFYNNGWGVYVDKVEFKSITP